ncbi:MAG: hypothetical protein Unbinned1068contig1001_36 [Prokaryotic dsDNA virus sp.]|nr:MAG: hypothetical protein Unbinned1068contig1001_36 [Prokaryotic dsDNA virus sp.]|tara:strand:- start:21682 stop:21927 length:246 start_codon:yes stop_codon:yes gene_type:complete
MHRDSDRSGSGLRRSGFYQGSPNPGPDIGALMGAAGKFMKSYEGDKKEESPEAKAKDKGSGLKDIGSLALKYGPMVLKMLG